MLKNMFTECSYLNSGQTTVSVMIMCMFFSLIKKQWIGWKHNRESFLHILRLLGLDHIHTFLTTSMIQGPGSECHSSEFPAFKRKGGRATNGSCYLWLPVVLLWILTCKKNWKDRRALTMTLPPQTYPLHPIVALAWAALGAGARPCTEKLSLWSHLRILKLS